jgi:hypothetical protein
MVNWKEFDERQREIFQQTSMMDEARKSLFDFPAGDPTSLLQKPMNPSDEFDGIITKDITTANLQGQELVNVSILLTSAVALNESGKLFLSYEKMSEEKLKAMSIEELSNYQDTVQAKKWLDATVTLIRASASSKTAVSKANKGWLGELFVTLKRTGEISAQFMKQKGGMFK